MDFKEKKRRHQEWVQAGKEFSDVMRKYSIDRLDDGLYTSIIMSKFPDALPQCECTDDGDRALGIEKKSIKGGQYQLRVCCRFCFLQGTRNLRWDEVGRDSVIFIFANHFVQEKKEVKNGM